MGAARRNGSGTPSVGTTWAWWCGWGCEGAGGVTRGHGHGRGSAGGLQGGGPSHEGAWQGGVARGGRGREGVRWGRVAGGVAAWQAPEGVGGVTRGRGGRGHMGGGGAAATAASND